MHRIRTTGIGVAALALVAGSVAGCSAFVPTTPTVTGSPCNWMTTPAASTSTAHTVILIDRSNSTRSTVGKDGPDYTDALSETVDTIMSTHDAVTIGSFDASASTVDWVARDQRTTRGQNDAQNQRTTDRQARDCLNDELAKAADQPATEPGTDVLGAVTAGAQELAQVTGAKNLVVVTDGLSTVGCTDLRHVGIGIVSEIPAVVSLCEQRRELPTIPASVSITFIGVGHPAASQPHPTTPQLDWLQQLWTTLCHSMHPRSEDPKTCFVNPAAPQPDTSGHPTTTPNVDDPPVTFPAAGSGVRTSTGAVVYPLGDILFDFDKSSLNSAGIASADRIAEQVRRQSGATATVNGYTDERGSEQYNDMLSQGRARSVASVLSQYGVVVTNIEGHGEADPVCTPEYQPNGSPDEQAMQCDRRVEVVVNAPHQ